MIRKSPINWLGVYLALLFILEAAGNEKLGERVYILQG